MRGAFLLTFVVFSLVCLTACVEPLTDEQWLKSEEDVQTLAEVTILACTQ